jgi:myosin-5
VECLANKVAVLKQALQQASNASSLNASLQQEITRLTEDNLSLLETVEEMRRGERAGYRTPMSPRRRTTPCGADSPQRKSSSSVKRHVTFSDQQSTKLPKKWSSSQHSRLVRELVLELDPDRVSGQIPCLPAHMIHLALHYCRHVTGSGGLALAFLGDITSALQQVVQGCSSQFSSLSFWLANITHLLSLLHKTSQTGIKTSLKPGSRSGVPPGSVTSDLSVRADKLESLAQATYRDLFQLIHNRIQPLIVPGLLECDSIPNISNVRPILGCHAVSHDPNITVATVTRELSAIMEVLHKHCLAPGTVAALMKQTFFTINAFLLNNLLLRRDMCHWSRGIQIRYF